AYARLINAAKVAPTCGSISNDIVRKHLEIPACNTCLVTQRTVSLEAAGFKDLESCVFVDEQNVIERLDWLFENPDELQRITSAGQKLVEMHHTIEHRDQIFQWYNLSKQAKPGQRIIQPGPFLPLTLVQDGSATTHNHLDVAGMD